MFGCFQFVFFPEIKSAEVNHAGMNHSFILFIISTTRFDLEVRSLKVDFFCLVISKYYFYYILNGTYNCAFFFLEQSLTVKLCWIYKMSHISLTGIKVSWWFLMLYYFSKPLDVENFTEWFYLGFWFNICFAKQLLHAFPWF